MCPKAPCVPLIAVDWENLHRFADEIPLDSSSLLVGDPAQGNPPEVYAKCGARYEQLGIKGMSIMSDGKFFIDCRESSEGKISVNIAIKQELEGRNNYHSGVNHTMEVPYTAALDKQRSWRWPEAAAAFEKLIP